MLEQCAVAAGAGQLSLKHSDHATLSVQKLLQLLLFLLDNLQLLVVSGLQGCEALFQVAVVEKKHHYLIDLWCYLCSLQSDYTIVDKLSKTVIKPMFIDSRLQ